MNTIVFTSSIVAIFTVYVSSTEHLPSKTVTTINGPYNFNFSSYHQVMHIVITLKNIPSSVTTASLIYSGQFNFDPTDLPGETTDLERVDKEIKNGPVTIPFQISVLKRLGFYKRIWIDVELKNTEGLCTKSKVAEGRHTYSPYYWDFTLRKKVYWNTNWAYDSTGSCIAPKTCEIVIDFHNQCEEKFSCDYNATKYTCTLHHENLKYSQIYELHQMYNHEPLIEVYLYTIATNTKLIIELESFDNNTSVSVTKPKKNNDILVIGSNEIILTAKDVGEDKIVRTLNYSESTDIQFNCEEYLSQPKITPVFTILINTKENKLKALHEAQNTVKYRLNMEDNRFILCCMYYSSEWTADGVYGQITRVVANKTLLMYQPKEPVSHKVENPASSSTTTTTTTTTDKVQTIESSTTTNANSSSTTTTTTTTTDKVQTIESSSTTNANNVKTSNSTVTIVLTLCGIAFTVLVTFVIWKRCCSTRSPQGTRGLPTPTHEPFYLNRLFRRECDQEIAEIEAHTYEEIDPQYASTYEEMVHQYASTYEEIVPRCEMLERVSEE